MSVVPGPRPRRLDLRVSDLLLIVILTLAALRLIGLVVAPPGPEFGPTGQPDPHALIGFLLTVLGLQACAMVAAVYLVAVRWRGITWAELGLRPVPKGWIRRAIWIALAAFPLTIAVNLMVSKIAGGVPLNPQIGMVAPVGFSWFALIGMLAVVGAAMPFVEELVFRGILYRWLRDRWGVPAAALASALCFSSLHGIPWLVPAIAILGVILALVYEKSGSLWPAVITHGTYNAISLVLVYLMLASGVPVT